MMKRLDLEKRHAPTRKKKQKKEVQIDQGDTKKVIEQIKEIQQELKERVKDIT
jgi:hypothetical protein